jgi:DNA-binding CsgD family transcriptional regulator
MHDGSQILFAPLTSRELEVVQLIATGLSAKQVAQRLEIGPRTVERYLDQVRLKTRTRNRVHMVAHAIQEGLIIGSRRHADPQRA